ncbi:MAG: flavodoxin family protein [Thermodesulfobacteriota bacterium]
MKLISIIGSPKGMKGNTALLLNPMLEAAQNAGAETEIYSLGDLSVLPCNGCQEACHTTGICQQKDDFEKIKNAMIEADGIIFASPNYTFNVSAHMKALLDRCNLLLHCQSLTGKYGAVVVTSGGSDPEVVENYLLTVIKNYGFWRLGSISAVRAQLEDADEKAKLMKSAAVIGNRMVEAIKNHEKFPDQEDERNQAFEIMKFMVTMLKEEWPFPFDYWKKNWKLEE